MAGLDGKGVDLPYERFVAHDPLVAANGVRDAGSGRPGVFNEIAETTPRIGRVGGIASEFSEESVNAEEGGRVREAEHRLVAAPWPVARRVAVGSGLALTYHDVARANVRYCKT